MMKLIKDWKNIAKKAWSIRLMVAAAILSGIEIIVPFFYGFIPDGAFAGLSFITVTLACLARLLAQKEIHDA